MNDHATLRRGFARFDRLASLSGATRNSTCDTVLDEAPGIRIYHRPRRVVVQRRRRHSPAKPSVSSASVAGSGTAAKTSPGRTAQTDAPASGKALNTMFRSPAPKPKIHAKDAEWLCWPSMQTELFKVTPSAVCSSCRAECSAEIEVETCSPVHSARCAPSAYPWQSNGGSVAGPSGLRFDLHWVSAVR